MDDFHFWELIEDACARCEGSTRRVSALLTESLVAFPLNNIIHFDTIFERYLDQCFTENLWSAYYVMNADGYISTDMFICFRAWLIAQGRTIFTTVMRDPEWLADNIDFSIYEMDAECMLYVASDAYEMKVGNRDDFIGAGGYNNNGVKHFEFPSQEELDQLKYRFPKLHAKFKQDGGVSNG